MYVVETGASIFRRVCTTEVVTGAADEVVRRRGFAQERVAQGDDNAGPGGSSGP